MKNIHVLPTDKPSRVFITKEQGLGFDNQMLENTELDCQNQNIYITSDEEPRQGEWSLYQNKIHKCIEDIIGDEFKKIILTTDQHLIKDGVQAIDDEFLEWFVKNPSCEEVEFELDYDTDERIINGKNLGYYSYIIPNLEILINCEDCGGDGIYITNDSERIKCPWCEKGKVPKEEPTEEAKQRAKNYMSLKGALEPKQETLEEAAENSLYSKEYLNQDERIIFKKGCVYGAKWQEEQDKYKYSEEEVFTICRAFATFVMRKGPSYKKQQEWFEQFKKKQQ